MRDPVRLFAEGNELVVRVMIPTELNDGKEQHYECRTRVCDSTIATEATVRYIQDVLDARIQTIRREAYEQGVRDRSRKAKSFSPSLNSGIHRGGCWGHP